MKITLLHVPENELAIFDKEPDRASYLWGEDGQNIFLVQKPPRVHVPTFKVDVAGPKKSDVLELFKDTITLRVETLLEAVKDNTGEEIDHVGIVIHGHPRISFKRPPVPPEIDKGGEWCFESKLGFFAPYPAGADQHDEDTFRLEVFEARDFLKRSSD